MRFATTTAWLKCSTLTKVLLPGATIPAKAITTTPRLHNVDSPIPTHSPWGVPVRYTLYRAENETILLEQMQAGEQVQQNQGITNRSTITAKGQELN